MPKSMKQLLARTVDGRMLCAEGYMWAFERRGYLSAGSFAPQVVLDYPDLVLGLYREMVHAGSDVVLAYTYYGHREKLKNIGVEDKTELLNRRALKLARQVADETGKLMAGDLSNTTIWQPDDDQARARCVKLFKEQIKWAVEEGADFIVAETFQDYGEAALALDCIKDWSGGLPAVITITPHTGHKTSDDVPIVTALKRLEDPGADVVGLNCARGPETMLPLIEEARRVCKGPLAALPCPFRTDADHPTWHFFKDPRTGQMAWPVNMDAFHCTNTDIEWFTQRCMSLGVQYFGICCGNSGHFTRTMAETLARDPPSLKYKPDMAKSSFFSTTATGHALKVRQTMFPGDNEINIENDPTNAVKNGVGKMALT